MIPLTTHQRAWSLLCVHADGNSDRDLKNYNKIFSFFVFTAHLAVIITSTAFVVRNARIDLKGSLHALLHLTAFMGMAYVLVIAYIIRDKITAIFEQLTEIHTKSKDSASFCGEIGFSSMSDQNRTFEMQNDSTLLVKCLRKLHFHV